MPVAELDLVFKNSTMQNVSGACKRIVLNYLDSGLQPKKIIVHQNYDHF